jgi:hypothetical protein
MRLTRRLIVSFIQLLPQGVVTLLKVAILQLLKIRVCFRLAETYMTPTRANPLTPA